MPMRTKLTRVVVLAAALALSAGSTLPGRADAAQASDLIRVVQIGSISHVDQFGEPLNTLPRGRRATTSPPPLLISTYDGRRTSRNDEATRTQPSMGSSSSTSSSSRVSRIPARKSAAMPSSSL